MNSRMSKRFSCDPYINNKLQHFTAHDYQTRPVTDSVSPWVTVVKLNFIPSVQRTSSRHQCCVKSCSQPRALIQMTTTRPCCLIHPLSPQSPVGHLDCSAALPSFLCHQEHEKERPIRKLVGSRRLVKAAHLDVSLCKLLRLVQHHDRLHLLESCLALLPRLSHQHLDVW